MADDHVRTGRPITTLATSREGAVLFAEIDGAPMNLLGPELVHDLVVAHPICRGRRLHHGRRVHERRP